MLDDTDNSIHVIADNR